MIGVLIIDYPNKTNSDFREILVLQHIDIYLFSLESESSMAQHPDRPTDARARLRAHFQGDLSNHAKKWDELWVEGFLPWDKGFPSPALVDLLEERKDLFPAKQGRRKALVPGCGKGYDVLLLSAWGYDAYGLEVSVKALENAKKVEMESSGRGIYKTKEGVEKGTVTWLTGDFFDGDFLKGVKGEESFELIYDYTVCIVPVDIFQSDLITRSSCPPYHHL